MSTAPPDFLKHQLPTRNSTPSRPHITVTWAQSLDSKIAGPGGSRIIISGSESMLMTHWMRSMHDAILIGINTLILDDPRLGIQLLSQDDESITSPQPIILDPQLRFPLTSRILTEWNKSKGKGKARQPWLICGDQVSQRRIEELEVTGVRVIPHRLDARGRIPPNDLPDILSTLGLASVMIEGGSRILSSFLTAPPRKDGSSLVDSVIVTVAPMFIGEGIGVVPAEDEKGLPILDTVHTKTMGKDAVMVCRVRPPI